jgi:hypothetical protein
MRRNGHSQDYFAIRGAASAKPVMHMADQSILPTAAKKGTSGFAHVSAYIDWNGGGM